MSGKTNIHVFTAWAKIQSSKMALKYVKGVNVGKDMDVLLDKLLLLRSYIKSFENYRFACCSEFIFKGEKHLKSGRVILSPKNSLFLESQDRKIKIESDSLNCVSIKELCLLAENIRAIIDNC